MRRILRASFHFNDLLCRYFWSALQLDILLGQECRGVLQGCGAPQSRRHCETWLQL